MNATLKRWAGLVGLAALAGALLLTLAIGTLLAQGPTPTPPTRFGGWGGFGWGPGGMMGGGMMGGCGGWGGWGAPGTGTPISIDQAVEATRQYLATYGNPDLTLTEVMEFTNNFYAEVKEKSTGVHAFELLINRYTGAVYPEPGPNMMWNTKYGHMGGMMGGMMGGWWGFGRQAPTAQMPVTPAQARQYTQQYLDANWPGATAADEADTFYGYYTIHVLRNGQLAGMLSVNGYTGQVWYHTWHGDFVRMTELEG